MAEKSVCIAATNIPVVLNDEIRTMLKKEGLTMSSFLRLVLEDFHRTGKPSVAIPDAARNQAKKRGALKKSVEVFSH